MDKRFLTILAVIAVVFVGIIFVNTHKKTSQSSSTSSSQPTNHITGNPASKVTLVEYGDYECPVCENYYPVIQQVEAKYAATVKFQFRHLPLLQIHPNAFAGARAAEAADLQGKFWQMHDALYQNGNWSQWSTSSNPNPFFDSYAKTIGLDVTKFKADFASSTVNDRINADLSAFKKTGQDLSTPSYFVNGTHHTNNEFVDNSGAPSVDAFSKVLDAALAKAK